MKASHLEPLSSLKRKTAQISGPLRGAHLESLEHRMLLAAAVTNGSLVVDGTTGVDAIAVTTSGNQIVVTINGQQSQFDPTTVGSIAVNGLDQGDTISVSVNRPTTVTGG